MNFNLRSNLFLLYGKTQKQLESLTDTFDGIKTVANIYHTDPVGDSTPIYRGPQVAHQSYES